jgi:hypothetical protein
MTYESDRDGAADRQVGLDVRSRQHRGAYRRWRKRAISGAVVSAVLGAAGTAAAIAGISGESIVAVVLGVAALAAAGLTAWIRAARPGQTAEDHNQAARRFSALGVAYGTFVRGWRDDEKTHAEYLKLEAEHRAAVEKGPEPEEWAEATP